MILRSIHQFDSIFTWYWCTQREQSKHKLQFLNLPPQVSK